MEIVVYVAAGHGGRVAMRGHGCAERPLDVGDHAPRFVADRVQDVHADAVGLLRERKRAEGRRRERDGSVRLDAPRVRVRIGEPRVKDLDLSKCMQNSQRQ